MSKTFSVFPVESGGIKKEKWMVTQTPTNWKNPVEGGVLNPKSKDKYFSEKSHVRSNTNYEKLAVCH
ncbi:MAG: hypothetical protein F6K17_03690 [Okeania sp. SIO3C4]|nr:hypothetical protein [Okeania sp. SIO3C4]